MGDCNLDMAPIVKVIIIVKPVSRCMAMLDSCAIEFDLKHRSFKKLSIDELLSIDFTTTDSIYWIHSNLNQVDIHKKLIAKCHLPDDVVKLCDQMDSIPTTMDTDESLTIQFQCLMSTELKQKTAVNFGNLILHLTSTFCFTASSDSIPVLLEFMESSKKSLRYAKTPCFMVFLILDIVINDYAKMLYHFDVISDQMDLRVRKSHKNIYNEVIRIKQQLMKIKRSLIALREILLRISSRKISVVSKECRVSLSHLANHSHLVVHEVDSVRDILNSLLDQIENNLMQSMTQTMRILTALSMVFLPLTLIAGIYGMNFHWIPELSWSYGYFYALGLMITCASIILYIFKKMKWF